MTRFAKKNLIIVLVLALVAVPLGSAALATEYFEAEEPSGSAMLFDFILVRPVGLIATAVGSVAYVLSLPFSALGNNMDTAGEKLVKEPAAYTFSRPLGVFQAP